MAVRARLAALAILTLALHAFHPAAAAEGSRQDSRDRKIFDLLDDNHDGVISMPEFKNNQMLIFYLLDRNKDQVLVQSETNLPPDVFDRIAGPGGKINTIEFLNIVDEAFKRADTNHDNVIDRKEFNALMRRIRQQ
ncbi:EF-hand domain-containing protein [Azospirillum sp. sgz301742]